MAAAPVPPPPVKVIVGMDVYPAPPLVKVMLVTAPVICGGTINPEIVPPGCPSLSKSTSTGSITAVALANDPPPPLKEIVGAVVYSVPPLVRVIAVTRPPDTVAVA